MKTLILALFLAGTSLAQTRTVTLTWVDSTTIATGYVIYAAPSQSQPYVQIGCTGTVAKSTCVSKSTKTTRTFTDTEIIGTTLWYQVEAVNASGASQPIEATVTIPPEPLIATVTIATP